MGNRNINKKFKYFLKKYFFTFSQDVVSVYNKFVDIWCLRLEKPYFMGIFVKKRI